MCYSDVNNSVTIVETSTKVKTQNSEVAATVSERCTNIYRQHARCIESYIVVAYNRVHWRALVSDGHLI